MSSSVFILSDNNIPDASEMRFGIVCAEWNNNITFKLLEGALSTLKEYGVQEQAIKVMHVPGSFELIHGCAELARHGWVDAIIAIGRGGLCGAAHLGAVIARGSLRSLSRTAPGSRCPLRPRGLRSLGRAQNGRAARPPRTNAKETRVRTARSANRMSEGLGR